MKRRLVPVFVAALAAAAAFGCHGDKSMDNTAGTTDTIQTGSPAGGGIATNSSGGASPAMSTTAPVPEPTSAGTTGVTTAVSATATSGSASATAAQTTT